MSTIACVHVFHDEVNVSPKKLSVGRPRATPADIRQTPAPALFRDLGNHLQGLPVRGNTDGPSD